MNEASSLVADPLSPFRVMLPTQSRRGPSTSNVTEISFSAHGYEFVCTILASTHLTGLINNGAASPTNLLHDDFPEKSEVGQV